MLSDSLRHPLERLLSGKTFPLPQGKRARRTSEPTTCTACAGEGKLWPDKNKFNLRGKPVFAAEKETCDDCSGLGKVFEWVTEDDPTVLQSWTGAEYTEGGGFAERHRADGQRVAYVENDQGDISIGIEPPGGRSYTIHFSAQYDDDLLPKRRSGDENETLTWAIALRLADAELVSLQRET